MNQPKDFDDGVRSEPVDDEVTRITDPASWFSTLAEQPNGEGKNTLEPGNVDAPDDLRIVAECCHGHQYQLTVSSGCLQAIVTRAFEKKSVDLIFSRPGEPVNQSVVDGKARLKPRHHSIVKVPLIVRVRDSCISACLDVGRTSVKHVREFDLLTSGLVDKAPYRGFKERCRADSPSFSHLSLDHELKLFG